MRKLVVDSSVVIKWFVPEPLSNEARRVLDDYQTGAVRVLAPDLIIAEVGNIVWKKRSFQGLADDDARAVLDQFLRLTLTLTPTQELLDDAYGLAVAYGRSVYDAFYLALSIRESCPFVTADERLTNAVKAGLPEVTWLGDWR